MLLNPSWFVQDRLAASLLGGDSTYWIELQASVNDIEAIFLDAVYVA
jgi:hypothetical protein